MRDTLRKNDVERNTAIVPLPPSPLVSAHHVVSPSISPPSPNEHRRWHSHVPPSSLGTTAHEQQRREREEYTQGSFAFCTAMTNASSSPSVASGSHQHHSIVLLCMEVMWRLQYRRRHREPIRPPQLPECPLEGVSLQHRIHVRCLNIRRPARHRIHPRPSAAGQAHSIVHLLRCSVPLLLLPQLLNPRGVNLCKGTQASTSRPSKKAQIDDLEVDVNPRPLLLGVNCW